MSRSQAYTSKVMNRSGYVIELPNVGEMSELLQTLPPNPYALSAVQLFPLGTKMIQGERVWRYCRNGAGTPAIRSALQGAASIHANADWARVISADVALGAYEISVTSTADVAVGANYYKEGYLFVNEGAGLGQEFKIKSHEAMVGDGNAIFTLYDPVRLAIECATGKVGLRKSPYDAVVQALAPLTNICVGVCPIVLVASRYFWSQTGGPAACRAKAAITKGQHVTVGTEAGEVSPAIADLRPLQVIGVSMTTGDTENEYILVFLTLDR